jgi:hypothetical protein
LLTPAEQRKVVGIILSKDELIELPEVLSRSDGSGDIHVKVYRDVTSLEELRPFWHCKRTWFAGSLDFFLSVVCASPEVVRPHVIALFREDQPQALLLGRLERRKIGVSFGYVRVPTPTLNILTFDDAGWVSNISAADSEVFAREILDALRTGEAEAANLHHLDITHPLYRLARSRPGWLFSDHLQALQIHWMRRLKESGSFLQSLPIKQRYNHRRRARLLQDAFDGKVEIRCFRESHQLERLMEDAEAVARTSYQRRLGVGFIHDEQMRHRLTLAAKQGALRAHVLYVEGRPCAFWITWVWAGVLSSEYMAFDPTFAKYGPGSYLVINAIEEACKDDSESPVMVIDFGFGDAEWKALLANQRTQIASPYIFSPTIKATTCNLLRTIVGSADSSVKAILMQTGLLSDLKRKWRRALPQG